MGASGAPSMVRYKTTASFARDSPGRGTVSKPLAIPKSSSICTRSTEALEYRVCGHVCLRLMGFGYQANFVGKRPLRKEAALLCGGPAGVFLCDRTGRPRACWDS